MIAKKVEASWQDYPSNWDFVGVIFVDPAVEPPNFINIDGVRYKKEPEIKLDLSRFFSDGT